MPPLAIGSSSSMNSYFDILRAGTVLGKNNRPGRRDNSRGLKGANPGTVQKVVLL